jgi:hypothetical protein
VVAGFAEIDYRTRVINSTIYHELKHTVFIGSLEDGNISEEGNWDYIKSRCEYRVSEKVPQTFKGVSGGGIWAVRLQVSKDDTWSVKTFCLLGVVFYETAIADNMTHLIGHFTKTIYQTTRKANC